MISALRRRCALNGILPRRITRFARAREGVTAVEFAMVAPVFFGLLLAIFEVSFNLLTSQLLETAAIDTSRLVLTGQAGTLNKDTFKAKVCTLLPAYMDCDDKVRVNAQVLTTFDQNVDIPKKGGNGVDKNDFDPTPSKFAFNAGTQNQIIMVRIYYRWTGLIAGVMSNFGLNLANQSDGSTLMVSTVVFKNEPY